VGRRPGFDVVIGKHSGTAAILHHFRARGIPIDPPRAASLLEPIRNRADALGRGLTPDETRTLYLAATSHADTERIAS
jgi:homocitrate synthase NifV